MDDMALMIAMPGYHFGELVSESANSRIFRAHRVRDGLPVILKMSNTPYPSQERLLRFRREYELMQKAGGDGVATAYALESHEGVHVIVLEDFGGRSLDLSPLHADPSLSQWLQVAIRITHCLGCLHRSHIMHKDVNPSNIVWNRATGQVKLIGLGIASEWSENTAHARSRDRLEGTLAYISPEQTGRINHVLDYRTDFYSLGVTFYEMLTGRLPFQAKDTLELVHAHLARRAVPACEVNPNIPRQLSSIIEKLMSKSAAEGYQSAVGLKADLQTCLRALESGCSVPEFAPGRHDFSERLQISQRLYGRDDHLDMLLCAYQRCIEGHAQLLLVAGYSGVGKSALVREIQKPILQHRGYFIEGKFEQFKRNIPYASLIQAFGNLVRQILTQDDAAVAQCRDKVLDALGSNGAVITDIIADLCFIIGEQPAVVELPVEQAQYRFHREFLKFVNVFATAEHPLVIFLDDLQWADVPSLRLLSLLMRPGSCSHLLVIGAYRDNEVAPAHPLQLILEEIRQGGAAVDTVTLLPLGLGDVTTLLCDTLHATPAQVATLASLCLGKTMGNPFFLTRFLKALADEALLRPNTKQGRWEWDTDTIEQADMTDNVVDLMVSRLHRLPEAAQQMLQAAACLGNVFDLKALSLICEMTQAQVGALLWEASREELVVPVDALDKHADGVAEGTRLCAFRFLHDKVQHAAYMLCGDAEKAARHLAIGRLWLQSLSSAQQQQAMFDLANHLNLGSALISDSGERLALAQLNLSAARRAKASVAYMPALTYLRNAVALMSREDWVRQYELMLALHLEAAEAAYLAADFKSMDHYVAVLREHATGLLDRVKTDEVRIQAYSAQRNYREAILLGFEVLALLGVTFPKNPGRTQVLWGALKTKLLLGKRKVGSLAQLPVMQEPHALISSRIFRTLGSSAYRYMPLYMPLFIFNALQLSLKHGNAAGSAYVYAAYGMFLIGVMQDMKQGMQYGELALAMAQRSEMNPDNSRALFVVHWLVQPWNAPLHASMQPLKQDYLRCIDMGDAEFAISAASAYGYAAFYCGSELPQLADELSGYSSAIESMQHPEPIRVQWQVLLNLADQSADPCVLQGVACDECQILKTEETNSDKLLMFNLYVAKLILCCLFHRHAEALENAARAERYIERATGSYTVAVFFFYESLALAATLAAAGFVDRRRMLRKIRANQKRIAHWADHAPANFLNKWHLIQAEVARHTDKPLQAIEHYEQAIRFAKQNNFPHEEALAKELAGEFYLDRDQESIAGTYLKQAQYGYHCWGALAKVRDMGERHPQWLHEEILAQAPAETCTSLTRTDASDRLDFAAAIKASHAISQEIVLGSLLKRFMHIIMENAGAQRGVLLLRKGGDWRIEAEQSIDQAEASVLQSEPLDGCADTRLSLSLVHCVARTGESMLVKDAMEEKFLINDPYVQRHRPRSLLSTPILHHGSVMGILYLENNAVSGAFTDHRLELLRLLTSQAAISIENARLYSDMEARVADWASELKAIALQDALSSAANLDKRIADKLAGIRREGQATDDMPCSAPGSPVAAQGQGPEEAGPECQEAQARETTPQAGTSTLRWITATVGNSLRLIPVEDIIFFQSDQKYTRVVMAESEVLIKKSLKELLAELDPAHFWKVHRSIVVNALEVASIEPNMAGEMTVKLKKRREQLPVSESFVRKLRQM